MPAILEDLEIDSSDMLSDYKAFARRVIDKSQELAKILKDSISVASFTENVKENAEKKIPSHIQTLLDNLYTEIDKLTPEEIVPCVEAIRRLSSDVDYMLKDKIAREVTLMNSSVMDKRIAHQYYINLKKLYDHFKVTIGIIDPVGAKKLPEIPVLRGNYGGGLEAVKNYLYVFDNEPGEEYWNWMAVARKLGVYKDCPHYSDFVEWLDANPNCGVSVIEKVL